MLYLTQLVYIQPGAESAFHAFEAVALPLLSKYGGELLLRLRPTPDCVVSATTEVPYEIHLLRFQSEADLEQFSQDPERRLFLHLKQASVRASLLVKGVLA